MKTVRRIPAANGWCEIVRIQNSGGYCLRRLWNDRDYVSYSRTVFPTAAQAQGAWYARRVSWERERPEG
jgi:hypothetical protein